MKHLIQEIKACDICEEHLPLGPRPIIKAHSDSKIVLISQAPCAIAHASGTPWDDKGGENLRSWMGLDKETFFDTNNLAIVPMGFCYPGRGKSGDLPPRLECAPKCHESLLRGLKNVELTLLIGMYAQKYYLGDKRSRTLTETVKNFHLYLPEYFVLPHLSPRNNICKQRTLGLKKK